METEFLQSLVRVVRGGSIAAAARAQGISAGTVALRLKTLEAEFGGPLVTRSGRTVVATELGARVVGEAQALLRAVEDMRGLAAHDGMVGQMRLGVIASAATGLLVPMLDRFAAAQPIGRVMVQRGVSSVLYSAVLNDDLDAAIIVEPDFRVPKSCGWQRLTVEPLILLTSTTLRVDDPHAALACEPLIRYSRSQWGGGIADDYLRHAGLEPRERYELDALDSIAMLVSRGLGVALVPEWAGLSRSGLPVVRHALPVTGFERRVGLIWSRATIRARQVNRLAECAVAALLDLAA